MSTVTETILWHLESDELPDAGVSVLMFIPTASDPVYFGYWDDESQAWIHDSGLTCKEQVTHWAEIPGGPSDGDAAQRSAN